MAGSSGDRIQLPEQRDWRVYGPVSNPASLGWDQKPNLRMGFQNQKSI